MKGLQYKDTFAVQGSELYKFLSEGKVTEAEKSYKETAQRERELMARLSPKPTKEEHEAHTRGVPCSR